MPKGAELTNILLDTGVYVQNLAYIKNGKKYWNCICPYDNNIFICCSSHLISKIRPTLSCGCLQKQKAAEILKKYRYDHTINLKGQKFGKLTVIEKVEKPENTNPNRKYAFWKCKCDCGNTCIINGAYLRNGDTISCGCIKSKGELTISKILKENNIPFEKEKIFSECKDKLPLPFDFYINNQYLIEFDGEQHFNKNGLNYDYIKKHDEIKNQWCIENNIPLIRIPYTILETLCLNDLLLNNSNYIVKY